jgi:hypothetical protein
MLTFNTLIGQKKNPGPCNRKSSVWTRYFEVNMQVNLRFLRLSFINLCIEQIKLGSSSLQEKITLKSLAP